MRNWINIVMTYLKEDYNDYKIYVDKIMSDVKISEEQLQNLKNSGFDVDEPLFHGSQYDFSELKKISKTANDIYTTPDPRTASFYGKYLYICYGKQNKQANLIDDDQLLRKLAVEFADRFEDRVEYEYDYRDQIKEFKQNAIDNYLEQNPEEDEKYAEWEIEGSSEYKQFVHKFAIEYTYSLLQSGEIYSIAGRNIQDDIISECFGIGYSSVKFYDYNSQGEPISVVFGNASDIIIIKKIDTPNKF